VNIAKSQAGFIDFIIVPSWDLLCNMLPNLKQLNDKIQENKLLWESKKDEYEERMERDKRMLRKLNNSAIIEVDEND